MALTLIEAAKTFEGDTLRSTIVELFALQSDLLGAIPFTDIQGNSYRYNQEDTLPGIAFRGVGEGYTESTGVINPQTENLTIVGGDLDVDRFIVKTMGGGHRAAHEAMKLKQLAHTFSHKVIKGDSLTTPKEFDGLQLRLTGSQLISNDVGTGAALSLAKLDELIDAVDEPTHLLMTKQMRRGLMGASRGNATSFPAGGNVSYELNGMGKRVMFYGELPILIADGNADVYATLANNEAAEGGGSDSTSIYCLSLKEGMLSGIQNGFPEVTDLGELDASPTFRTRIEWYPGLVLEHPRAAARLYGVDATVAVLA